MIERSPAIVPPSDIDFPQAFTSTNPEELCFEDPAIDILNTIESPGTPESTLGSFLESFLESIAEHEDSSDEGSSFDEEDSYDETDSSDEQASAIAAEQEYKPGVKTRENWPVWFELNGESNLVHNKTFLAGLHSMA